MVEEDKIREALAKDIIDAIFDQAEELNFAWHYGEESMLVTDVINIINNVAKTDYKRYGSGNLSYKSWNPHNRDNRCDRCTKLFSNFDKSEHRKHCAGCSNADNCTEFVDKWKE